MLTKNGRSSQTPEKGTSPNAGTSYGAGYQFGGVASGIGTPIVDNNNKNTEKSFEDLIPEGEIEDYSESGSGAKWG